MCPPFHSRVPPVLPREGWLNLDMGLVEARDPHVARWSKAAGHCSLATRSSPYRRCSKQTAPF